MTHVIAHWAEIKVYVLFFRLFLTQVIAHWAEMEVTVFFEFLLAVYCLVVCIYPDDNADFS